jgi:hypothetical protein
MGRPLILYFCHRDVVRHQPLSVGTLACYPNEDPFNVKNLPCLSFWLASVTTAVGGLLIVPLNDALLLTGRDSVSWETIVAPTRFALTTDTQGTTYLYLAYDQTETSEIQKEKKKIEPVTVTVNVYKL